MGSADNLQQMSEAQLRTLVIELRAENASLASLAGFLQTQAERERAALARELHDSLGGILTPAKMDTAWLEARLGKDPLYTDRLARLNTLIDDSIDLMRRIIEKLRPSLLDHLGLASALQWYAEDACRAANIECRHNFSEKLGRLSPGVEIALFRLVQESIANIVKHAGARSVDLMLERTDKGLELCVADDGVGMKDSEPARSVTHGMSSMMHRVRSLGGTFHVTSEPQKGTRINVFVPLGPEPK